MYLEDEDLRIVHIEIDSSVQEMIRFMLMSRVGQVQALEASSRQYESSKVTGFTISVEILPDYWDSDIVFTLYYIFIINTFLQYINYWTGILLW